jgi:CRISPR-associated protein (TIGR03984 family)
MKREINSGRHRIASLPIPPNFGSETSVALTEQAWLYHLRWLLVHADDGVIWGELRADGLHLSSDAFRDLSPPLRAVSLQQARLFGPDAELLVWKDDSTWRARLIEDGAGESGEYFDEAYLLWGTKAEQGQSGFLLLCEGKEGLRHSPPLPQEIRLPARLQVRHYLSYDGEGQAYIAGSRLVAIENQGGEE